MALLLLSLAFDSGIELEISRTVEEMRTAEAKVYFETPTAQEKKEMEK